MSKIKVIKHSWSSNIINPFNFVSENYYISKYCDNLHGQNIGFFYTKERRRMRRHGTQRQENKVNAYDSHIAAMRGAVGNG